MLRLCVAQINAHGRAHPLRTNDGSRYNQIRNRIEAIATERVAKGRRTQEKDRDRRSMMMDIEYRAISAMTDNHAPYRDESA